MASTLNRKYLWTPPTPEQASRHRRFTMHRSVQSYKPIDLRSLFPLPALDQGSLGSCGPNAKSKIMTFLQAKLGLPVDQPARLFLYYATRDLMGDTADDTGVDNDTMMLASERFGVCSETEVPYDVSQFAVKPSAQAYTDALRDVVTDEMVINQDVDSVYTVLASGLPLLTGITCFDSFEGDASMAGKIPVPDPSREAMLGGHDVVIGGIDVVNDFVWLGNSWGISYGISGWAQMPLSGYLLKPQLTQDIRVVRALGVGKVAA